MTMFTRTELASLRQELAADPSRLSRDPVLLGRLLSQAEYGLDCAQLLEKAVRYPAEPYGEAERLVAELTDGFNEIWNRHHYRDGGGRNPDAAGAPEAK